MSLRKQLLISRSYNNLLKTYAVSSHAVQGNTKSNEKVTKDENKHHDALD